MNQAQVMEIPKFHSHYKGMAGLGDTADDLAAMQPDVTNLIYGGGGSPFTTPGQDVAALASNLGLSIPSSSSGFSLFSTTGLLLAAGAVVVFMLVSENNRGRRR